MYASWDRSHSAHGRCRSPSQCNGGGCHVMSCHVMSCHVMALSRCRSQTQCNIHIPCTALLPSAISIYPAQHSYPVQWRGTSCHVMSCHVMSCHSTRTQCSTLAWLQLSTPRPNPNPNLSTLALALALALTVCLASAQHSQAAYRTCTGRRGCRPTVGV